MAGKINENHHYVPKFLLKNFLYKRKGEQVWVFDKTKDNIFVTNITNILTERGFYNFQLPEHPEYIATLEHGLADFDNTTSSIVKKITEQKNLFCLDFKEKVLLAQFISVQQLRTNQIRSLMAQIDSLLEEKISQVGGDIHDIENYEPLDENSLKQVCTTMITTAGNDFIPYILAKPWILLETTNKHPFLISDHPVTLYNPLNNFGDKTSGLISPGVEVNIPLSATLSLSLLCPIFTEDLRENLKQAQENKQMAQLNVLNSGRLLEYQEKNAQTESILKTAPPIINAIDKETPLPVNPENVLHLNSLQATFSQRFIISQDKKSLLTIQDLVRCHPSMKKGQKLETL